MNRIKSIINLQQGFVMGIMNSFFVISSAENFIRKTSTPKTKMLPRGLKVIELKISNDRNEYTERDRPQVGQSYPVRFLN
jgi:hypothetical protein